MDATKFDSVARILSGGLTRRATLRGLMAGAVTAAAGATALQAVSAKKDNDRCLKAGAFCESSKQCCPKETNRKCRVQRNAGNSDTTCCGVEGAECGGKDGNGDDKKPFCCVGYECRGTTCRRAR